MNSLSNDMQYVVSLLSKCYTKVMNRLIDFVPNRTVKHQLTARSSSEHCSCRASCSSGGLWVACFRPEGGTVGSVIGAVV